MFRPRGRGMVSCTVIATAFLRGSFRCGDRIIPWLVGFVEVV